MPSLTSASAARSRRRWYSAALWTTASGLPLTVRMMGRRVFLRRFMNLTELLRKVVRGWMSLVMSIFDCMWGGLHPGGILSYLDMAQLTLGPLRDNLGTTGQGRRKRLWAEYSF